MEWSLPSVVKALILSTITISTVAGNGLVLIAVLRRKKSVLKSATHVFILNLSLADFLVGILVMPFLAIFDVTGKCDYGRSFCTAFHVTHYWLCSASILSVTAICIERYIGVRFPLKHYKFIDMRRAAQACGTIWIIAGGLSLAPLIWPAFPDDPYDCPPNLLIKPLVKVMVCTFYSLCFVMVVCYSKIYCIVISHLEANEKRRGSQQGRNSLISHGETTSEVSSEGSRRSSGSEHSRVSYRQATEKTETVKVCRKKQASLSKKLAVVVSTVLVCYFPYFTTFLMEDALVPPKIVMALGWLRYFNSCLNPFIYAAMLKTFRDAISDCLKDYFPPWTTT